MEVRQLPASRPGAQTPLRMDPSGCGHTRKNRLGQEARVDRQVPDIDCLGPEFDLDRAVLRVAEIGSEISR